MAEQFRWSWPTAIVFGCAGLAAGVLVMRATASSSGLLESDKASLRALIREEIEGAARWTEPPSAPDGQEALGQLTPDERSAYENARSMIGQRIAQGSWTAEDVDRLRDSTAALPGALKPDLLKPLLIALNDGRLKWAGLGTPF